MKIAIGSTNPVKVRAARNVLRRVFVEPPPEFIALDVRSGVPAQPRGDKQTQRGAVNRARAARAQAHADFGVGLEAGIIVNEYGTLTTAWCALVDRAGRIGIGGSSNMLLPTQVAEQMRAGVELGVAMDAFAQIEDVKRKMGAIGVLTRGLSDRRRAYEFIVKMAVVRFLWQAEYR